MDVLACFSLKGGVGKTTSSVNLAVAAAEAGHRVLLWDLDAQAAASYYLRAEEPDTRRTKKLLRGKLSLMEAIVATDRDNLDVIPADESARHVDILLDGHKHPEQALSKLMEELRKDYDIVILDCPPSWSRLMEAVLYASRLLLTPVIPTPLSLRTLKQLRSFVKENAAHAPTSLAFFCMVDRRKSLHRELTAEARATLDGFFMSAIPYSAQVERMGEQQRPLADFAPSSIPNRAYQGLWLEIEQALVSQT